MASHRILSSLNIIEALLKFIIGYFILGWGKVVPTKAVRYTSTLIEDILIPIIIFQLAWAKIDLISSLVTYESLIEIFTIIGTIFCLYFLQDYCKFINRTEAVILAGFFCQPKITSDKNKNHQDFQHIYYLTTILLTSVVKNYKTELLKVVSKQSKQRGVECKTFFSMDL